MWTRSSSGSGSGRIVTLTKMRCVCPPPITSVPVCLLLLLNPVGSLRNTDFSDSVCDCLLSQDNKAASILISRPLSRLLASSLQDSALGISHKQKHALYQYVCPAADSA